MLNWITTMFGGDSTHTVAKGSVTHARHGKFAQGGSFCPRGKLLPGRKGHALGTLCLMSCMPSLCMHGTTRRPGVDTARQAARTDDVAPEVVHVLAALGQAHVHLLQHHMDLLQALLPRFPSLQPTEAWLVDQVLQRDSGLLRPPLPCFLGCLLLSLEWEQAHPRHVLNSLRSKPAP